MRQLHVFLLFFFLLIISCSKRDLDVIYNGDTTITNPNLGSGNEDEEEEENDDDDNDDDDETIAIVGENYICGSSITSFVPARYNGFGINSWSVVIYKAENIDYGTGTITSLSYLIDCKSSACEASPVTNQRIFFKLTNEDTITSTNYPNIDSMTEVYNGNITWKAGTTIDSSWTDIELNTPFVYDGSSNIMVYFENGNADTVGSILSCVGETPAFLWDYLGENRSLHATYNTTPSTPASTPTIDTLTPITKFTFN